jgi:hypothetical protein
MKLYGKDYSGLKYGRLTFVRRSERKAGAHYLWELLCECGNTCYAEPGHVVQGGTKSCGCWFDYTGHKYGRLTFIRRSERRRGKHPLWELLCDCGTTCYNRGNDVISGHVQSCGCYQKEGEHVRVYAPTISTARAVWRTTYKSDGLDFDTFLTLSQQPCDYCGDMLTNSHNRKHGAGIIQKKYGIFSYNGLDRIDSNKGHTADNVVPCCWKCNRMKGDMTREEFIRHNEKQYLHMTKAREELTCRSRPPTYATPHTYTSTVPVGE